MGWLITPEKKMGELIATGKNNWVTALPKSKLEPNVSYFPVADPGGGVRVFFLLVSI